MSRVDRKRASQCQPPPSLGSNKKKSRMVHILDCGERKAIRERKWRKIRRALHRKERIRVREREKMNG